MIRLRPILWLVVSVVPSIALLLGLGFWQLNRKGEKEAQIASLERSISATPIMLPPPGQTIRDVRVAPLSGKTLSQHGLQELTRVTLKGTFLQSRSVPVWATLPAAPNAPTSGIGFFWMTPLQMADGAIVFINRGFVPSGSTFRAPAIRTPEGEQTIIGLLRKAEKPSLFTPADNPAKGDYFSRDPVAMAGFVALSPDSVANFFVDAERDAGNLTPPVGINAREMMSRIPNNHLQYAGTWFAFAGGLLVIAILFGRQKLAAASKQGSGS